MSWDYELMVEVRCSNGHRGMVPVAALRDRLILLVCQKCEAREQAPEVPSKKPSLRERLRQERAEKEAVETEVSKFRQWLDDWGKPPSDGKPSSDP